MPIKNNEFQGIDLKRKLIYRNFHDIDGSVYLVEISKGLYNFYILLFPNFERIDMFIFEILREKIFLKLLTDNNSIYSTFVKESL
jgi:hypothetical protein